jgi:hypothetical protein
VPFYVSLGARGWVLHFGGMMTRVAGAGIYWCMARRRVAVATVSVRSEF